MPQQQTYRVLGPDGRIIEMTAEQFAQLAPASSATPPAPGDKSADESVQSDQPAWAQKVGADLQAAGIEPGRIAANKGEVWQNILDLGVPDTLAAIGTTAATGQPWLGAGAAGLVGALRSRLQGKPPEEAGLTGAVSGVAGLVPLLGRGLEKGGKAGIRSALVISKKLAEEVGPDKVAGVKALVDRIAGLPGSTLSKVAGYVGKGNEGQRLGRLGQLMTERERAVAQASAQGKMFLPEEALGPAEAETARITSSQLENPMAPRAAETFFKRTRTGPISQPMTPTRADITLRSTKFAPEPWAGQGAQEAARQTRMEWSRKLKDLIPALRPIMREQASLIPAAETVEDTLFTQGGRELARVPGMYISGGRPRIFSVIPAPPGAAFTAGKGMMRAGQALQTPGLDALTRTMLLNLMRQGSH